MTTTEHRRAYQQRSGIDWSQYVTTPHRPPLADIAASGLSSEIITNAHPPSGRAVAGVPGAVRDIRPNERERLYREDCTPGHHVWKFVTDQRRQRRKPMTTRYCVRCGRHTK